MGALAGVGFGTVFLAVMITASGNDVADFAVSSVVLMVLTLILMPVLMRAREHSIRRNTIQKALRNHGTIHPQPIKKGPQRLR